MIRRLCLMMLFLSMLVVTAGESHAQVRYSNGYGRVVPGARRYYGYGNGRFDNGFSPRRLNAYGYSNDRYDPYDNGYVGNGYGYRYYGNGYGNYGNGYIGYGNDYNYGNGFVYRGPLGFGLSLF